MSDEIINSRADSRAEPEPELTPAPEPQPEPEPTPQPQPESESQPESQPASESQPEFQPASEREAAVLPQADLRDAIVEDEVAADNGDGDGSPAPVVTGPSAAAPAPAKPDKAKAPGDKPSKSKSSKEKSGKGKSGKGKSGSGKSGKGKSDDHREAPVRLGGGSSAREEAAEGGDGEDHSRKLVSGAGRVLAGNFVTVILGVVAVGLAVALVLAMLQVSDQDNLDGARTSALSAASKYSVELASYDYRHLDQDFGVVLAHSTASFQKSFTESSNALKATLTKFHATASAKLVAAGVISATATRAVLLVLLDQTVTNSTQKQPTTDRTQVDITLVLTGGTWLIDQVTLL